jgi:hypothetical protein
VPVLLGPGDDYSEQCPPVSYNILICRRRQTMCVGFPPTPYNAGDASLNSILGRSSVVQYLLPNLRLSDGEGYRLAPLLVPNHWRPREVEDKDKDNFSS